MRPHDPNRSDPWANLAEGVGPLPIGRDLATGPHYHEDLEAPLFDEPTWPAMPDHRHPLPAWVGVLLFLNACLILAVVAVAVWR